MCDMMCDVSELKATSCSTLNGALGASQHARTSEFPPLGTRDDQFLGLLK
jgi:hypothetical protein